MEKIAQLKSRALLRLAGDDRTHFLQNLITCDVDQLDDGDLTFGALLTPQGKILFDFFVLPENDNFILDVESLHRDELERRLHFYKLRADVEISKDPRHVYGIWNGKTGISDPRAPDLGQRLYGDQRDCNCDEKAWQQHRIHTGMPQSGLDFELGTLFPHDALMDQMGRSGIDFSKGCYVGQEVVSRMQHRGSARNRFVQAFSIAGDLPAAGTHILAGQRKIGVMGYSIGNAGMALVRTDRVASAIEAGSTFTAEDQPLRLKRPGFAKFDWPS